MKKLLTLLLAVILAFSVSPLFACGGGAGDNSGNDGGNTPSTPTTPTDPDDPTPSDYDPSHAHDFNVEWDWDNLDANGIPTPILSCKVKGCDATDKALQTAFNGKTKGKYTVKTYKVFDTENLPTVESVGKGYTYVYAQERTGAKEIKFTDRHYGDVDKVTPEYLLPSLMVQYLTAETSAAQFDVLKNKSACLSKDQSVRSYTISPNIIDSAATFTVYDITDGFSRENVIHSNSSVPKTFNYKYYLPMHFYYWESVKDGEIIENGLFKFGDDVSTRVFSIEGVSNFRDLGGWTMGDGNRIPYGLIYRSGKLDTATTDKGKVTIKELGIKTELDLRNVDKNGNAPLDPHISGLTHYAYYMESTYSGLVSAVRNKSKLHTTYNGSAFTPNGKYETLTSASTYRDAYKDIFEILAEQENYPIVFNCVSGADRTGTLAFIIEGLLGVSVDDLTRDFELTSFSHTTRWRSNPNEENNDFGDSVYYTVGSWDSAFRTLLTAFNSYSGSTLAEKIEQFLIQSVGITAEQVQSIKTIFGYTL